MCQHDSTLEAGAQDTISIYADDYAVFLNSALSDNTKIVPQA